MYMSYCRHEGTYAELRACLSDAAEHINEEAEYEVSDREIQWFKNMVELFYDFLCEQDLLSDFGDLNTTRLDEIGEAMSKSYEPEDGEC